MDLATTLGRRHSAYIVSLPAEILALVFEICYRQYSNKISARKFVLKISHVSQQWRSAVACQQIFWTDVLITITKCTLLWPMEQCLQRSGALPIDVDITSTQKMDSEALKLVTRTICGALTSHANRWRSFHARCRAGTNMLLVMRGLRDITAPVLEDLQLALEEEEMDGGAPWRLRISGAGDGVPHDILNGGAPLLQSARMANALLRVPTNALRVIFLDNTHNANSFQRDLAVAALLNNLPLLQELTIRGLVADGIPMGEFASSKFSLPSLTSLRLLARTSYEPQFAFLGAISAPLLERVVLERVSILCTLSLQGVFPQVRTLVVDPGRAKHALAVLRHCDTVFPNITHLNVRGRALTGSPHSHVGPQIWPRMQVLTLHELQNSDVAPFCEWLVHRRQSCPFPRSIFLRSCDKADATALTAGLLTEGLGIAVHWSGGDDGPWYEE
ncbi:hypothetical protein FIBSPDRAFT_936221 [Athelia psychrophila]|uniref:F-box domain-containing protein n=1 Tax=Athelia psychrophila TaxID=1759441 RepID=A0A166CEV0_9AGAM|nr:hypothetical protein FIBSPDRAFT_936221 [Fibularhizoctonia sp. CBS 109695]